MLMIRLQRVGRKNDPSFRVVVTDSRRSTKTGSFIEIVGSYDARQGKPQFQAEKIKEWIGKGAQVSETVHNLLVKNKIIEGKTVNTVPVKKVVKTPIDADKTPINAEVKKEEAEESAPEATPEPVAESEPATPILESPVEEAEPEAPTSSAETESEGTADKT